MDSAADTVPALLARHVARRVGGLPTVSVLLGPVGAGGATWRRWADGAGYPVVTVHAPANAPAVWAAELSRRADLPAIAVESVADQLGRDRAGFRAEWRGKTAADVARFWDVVYPAPVPSAVRSLASLAADDIPPTPEAVVASITSALREAAALAPPRAVPAVLFVPPSGADPASWLAGVAAGVVGWVAHMPGVPAAIVVPAPAWVAYRAAAPMARTTAVLREGVIEIPLLGSDDVARTLAEAGLGLDAGAAAEVLAAGGATGELVRTAADAVRANIPRPATPEADDRARSAAERFLFDLLETIPETAGRFELNATLDFRFGPRPAEIDLLSRADRLAIEVDGHFHFLSPDDYRRDRSKDYELQSRGYVVLRFLAGDVVRRIEQVRDRILDAVAQAHPGGRP